jgi:hypothetical protein
LWNFDVVKDRLLILNVGVDSSFPYRETMTNSTSSDHYSILIAGTNNTQLASADQVSRAVDIRGYEKISIGQGIPTGYQGGPGLGRAGAFISGSVEANAGDRFRYTTTGNDTTVFVFTLMDFQNMERTGKFACNAPFPNQPISAER